MSLCFDIHITFFLLSFCLAPGCTIPPVRIFCVLTPSVGTCLRLHQIYLCLTGLLLPVIFPASVYRLASMVPSSHHSYDVRIRDISVSSAGRRSGPWATFYPQISPPAGGPYFTPLASHAPPAVFPPPTPLLCCLRLCLHHPPDSLA